MLDSTKTFPNFLGNIRINKTFLRHVIKHFYIRFKKSWKFDTLALITLIQIAVKSPTEFC